MESTAQVFTIGAFLVRVATHTYSITKNSENYYSGELKDLIRMRRTCFNKQKPTYTKASVALEYAIERVEKKKQKSYRR